MTAEEILGPRERQIKILQIPEDQLLAVLTGEMKLDKTSLPDDVKLLAVTRVSFSTDTIDILIESSEFEDVPVGQIAPSFIGARWLWIEEVPE